MLPIDEIRARLKAMPLKDLRVIERDTGVKFRAIRNIREGWVKNPRMFTVVPVSDWLERERGL